MSSSQASLPLVTSEVGRLETVLLHRPGEELRRITPSNMEELLFDELLWVERAQEEHDAFATVLTDAGVEVLYIEQLLADILEDPQVRLELLTEQVTERTCGPQAVGRVRGFLNDLGSPELAQHLFAGVSMDEVGAGPGLVSAVRHEGDTLLDPIPNSVFMRDSSAWIGTGVMLSPMNRVVRRRETALLRWVYTRHPRFAGTTVWFGDDRQPAYPSTVEGGDVLVVADGAVAIGISERTTSMGIETLASRLFAAGAATRVLAVDLPKVRAAMHLDTVATMVDRDKVVVYPQIVSSVDSYEMTPGEDGRIDVRRSDSLFDGLSWAVGHEVQPIAPKLTSTRLEREQWNDANNTLAIAPGEVVTYERTVATNQILRDAGITVHTIPSYELPRGRGGPRCMSCPIRRAPLD